MCHRTPHVYLPNGIQIRRTVQAGGMNATDRRQTERQHTEKCVATAESLALQDAIPPNYKY